ncbi:peptidoglycan DD-metalloendopeptidase family protein [Streptomyces aculeolatus]
MSRETRLLVKVAVGAGAVFVALLAMVLLTAGAWLPAARTHDGEGAGGAAQETTAGLAPGTVPAAYEDLIARAGTTCPTLSPPLLAAVLQAESGFNPNAESPKGAQGIAQFMPGTWATHGQDVNGGGADVWDPADAIPSAAGYLCTLADILKKIPGDPVDIMLAGYNAGPGAVQQAGGIPDYTETRNYIRRIRAAAKHFTGSPTAVGQAGYTRPVDAAVSTGYRAAGGQWSSGHHTGIDFAAPQGTRVAAAGSGRVVMAGYGVDGDPYGNTIVIQHPDGYYTQYAHLSAITVKEGQQVDAGQRIGAVGTTGTRSSGPHLHFEARTGPGYGSDIDPVAFLRGKGVTL